MADAPGSSPKPLPARIDRALLERVLARAGELQADSGEPVDEFTEEQLLELGREVGLSPQHLRQALAEERTRPSGPDEEHGIAARLIGPGLVRASRTIGGKAADVLATIDTWMQRQELLRVKRHLGDRMVWEPRRDLFGTLRRVLDVGGRDYALMRAHEVAATVLSVDDNRVLVSLEADLRDYRRRLARRVGEVGVVGAAATGSLFVIGAMAAVSIAPVVVLPALGAFGVRRAQRRNVSRAQLALEQLLDRLERGEFGRPPSVIGLLASATATFPRSL